MLQGEGVKMEQALEAIARTEEFAHIQDIGGIPTAITDQHNEVFYHWQKHNLENATLLHIDAHHDLFNIAAPFKEKLNDDYYEEVGIASFICAAVHYGIVSSIYWLNPFSSKRLQDMGSAEPKENRRKIETKVIGGRIDWASYADKMVMGEGIKITPEDVEFENQFILDIDLDAFSWRRRIISSRLKVRDTESGYEERIDQTIEVLRKLRRPDIITITRSQGKRICVPPEKVDAVQEYLLGKLREVYGK